MFWKNFWRTLKAFWDRLCNRKPSNKPSTVIDTAAVKVFGLDIQISREIPVNGPVYELTVVVPRAECRINKQNGSREIILSSITIAHSPRFARESKPEKASAPKGIAA